MATAFPLAFHNGQFVRAQDPVLSIFDRGLLYGDGLFETILVTHGRPQRWREHLDRLRHGAAFLHILTPYSTDETLSAAMELVRRNEATHAILRLTVTRGVGARGYSSRNARHPSVIMSLHAPPSPSPHAPPQWRLITSSVRLHPDDPLTRFKTCNRLPYVLARNEADADDADEALLLNTRGELAEAASANLFWIQSNHVFTPPVHSGILPGITRAAVIQLARSLGLELEETTSTPEVLAGSDGVFLTQTSRGIIEVSSLDHQPLPHSPLTARLHAAYARVSDTQAEPSRRPDGTSRD